MTKSKQSQHRIDPAVFGMLQFVVAMALTSNDCTKDSTLV
jgi:hypothetical protein